MLNQFYNDLEKAKVAEAIALEQLQAYYDYWILEDVSDVRECRYLGDIKATDTFGATYYIEVKDDSRIAETKKILCEEENYIKETDSYIKGNMSCQGDLYAIVSQPERKIYLLDYAKLREIYKKGEFKVIPHAQQITYCYLLELCRAKQWGALIDILEY